MKKLSLIALIFLLSCQQKYNPLQFDDQPIAIKDSVKIESHDRYYYSVKKPTRGTSAVVDIHNNNDTAKTFIVNITEQK
jgi:hypothetical protein